MRTFLIALAATTTLTAFAVQPAGAETTRSGANPAVTIGGSEMSGRDLIGRAVLTPDGRRIGEVSGLVQDKSTPNDVIISLDAENHQMGLIPGRSNSASGANDKSGPVVAGGSTVATPADSLRLGDNGTLVIDAAALATIADLKDRLQGSSAGSSAAEPSSAKASGGYAWKPGQDLRAEQVIGSPVYDRSGARVGKVAALVTDSADNVTYAVVDMGGDRKVTLPWAEMSARPDGDGLAADDDRMKDGKPFAERNSAYRNMPSESAVRWPQGQAKAER